MAFVGVHPEAKFRLEATGHMFGFDNTDNAWALVKNEPLHHLSRALFPFASTIVCVHYRV